MFSTHTIFHLFRSQYIFLQNATKDSEDHLAHRPRALLFSILKIKIEKYKEYINYLK